jgi:hypothetical protein
MTALRLCPLAAAVLALSACGGSDSSDGGAKPLQPVRSPALPINIASTTLTGTVNGAAVTVDFRETSNTGTATFDGQMAETGSVSLTVLEGPTPLLTSMATTYYLMNPYSLLGEVITVNGVTETALTTSSDPLPATLTVGETGSVSSVTYYAADGTTVIGSLTETYAVAANDAQSVKLSLYGAGTVNGVQSSQTEVYTVNSNGGVALVEIDILVNGQTLKFTASQHSLSRL